MERWFGGFKREMGNLSHYKDLPQFKEWALAVLDQQSDIETNDINSILESQNRAIESAHKEEGSH